MADRAEPVHGSVFHQGQLSGMDAFFSTLVGVSRWLALPVVLLLFLQWPLRDALGAGSREANDLGQILFALYVALALTAATRARAHFAVDVLAHRYSSRTRHLLHRSMSALVLLPWAAFVAWHAVPMARASLLQLERFQDTDNGGYFVIRAAVLVLAVATVAAALADVCSGDKGVDRDGRSRE